MGQGLVTTSHAEDGSIIFSESGQFYLDRANNPHAASRPVPFRNVFRWKLEQKQVSLFHERRGAEAAVWLFALVEAGDDDEADLISRKAHVCVDDHYRARLSFHQDGGFDLVWTISGPRKDERIHYRYRT